jgi:anti-anti-sigma regulatory factor
MDGGNGVELVMALEEDGRERTVGGPDRRLPRLLDDGPSHLVVDLSRLDRLSSGAVRALLHIHEQCRSRGVAVMLRRPSRRSLGVLRRAGLLAALPVERAGHPVRPAPAGQAGDAGQPRSVSTAGAPSVVASNRSGSSEA